MRISLSKVRSIWPIRSVLELCETRRMEQLSLDSAFETEDEVAPDHGILGQLGLLSKPSEDDLEFGSMQDVNRDHQNMDSTFAKKDNNGCVLSNKRRSRSWLGGRLGRPKTFGLKSHRLATAKSPSKAFRPALTVGSILERYQPVERVDLIEQTFIRLRKAILQEVQRRDHRPKDYPVTIFREWGRLRDGRPYIFIQPHSKTGVMVERTQVGWLLSSAYKDPSQSLFVKSGEIIDNVTLMMAVDRPVLPRIRSQVLGGDLLSLPIYEHQILSQLNLRQHSS